MWELLSSPFQAAFEDFSARVVSSCIICSPYITASPIAYLTQTIQSRKVENDIAALVLTDLSPANLVQGATDARALRYLAETIPNVKIVHAPRIHAKVFVCNDEFAIITSANFTDGGGIRNLEYGVRVSDRAAVLQVQRDIHAYAELGAVVDTTRLTSLEKRAVEVREAVREEQQVIRQKLRPLTQELKSEELARYVADDLIRIRLHGRTVHGIFLKTILYLLGQRPMTTLELNAAIRQIHPDLCDDEIERVIDGKRFGKRWKHDVRGAQVTLRRKGLVAYNKNTGMYTLLTGNESHADSSDL